MFTLGQRVRVRGIVQSTYEVLNPPMCGPGERVVLAPPGDWGNDLARVLVRAPIEPAGEGIIVGHLLRYCGLITRASYSAYDGQSPSYWTAHGAVRVWRVATTLRWREPLDVLAEDIEVVEA